MRFAKTVLLKTVLIPLLIAGSSLAADPAHWVASWGTSPAPQLPDEVQLWKAKLLFDNQTIRQIVHTSVGGDAIRLRLSNAYGKDSVEIGAVHVALRDASAGSKSLIATGSDRPVTFGGRPTVSIPPNGLVLSDPVRLAVPAAGDLAISIFLPKYTSGAGIHYGAQQTAYIAKGDATSAADLSEPSTIGSWVFLTGVEVQAPPAASAIVAFGDSITDGARSTADANRRWPDILAERLRARKSARPMGVVNSGIGGNRILHDGAGNVRFGANALARFERDALSYPGVKYVIVLEGVNDLGHPGTAGRPLSETVSAEDLIAGMKQMILRAHDRGIKIFGATLTPFEGTTIAGYFTPEKEAKRKALNEWIRSSKEFDGVIDFDKAIRDPQHPDRTLPGNDSGDHLHPNDAGYKVMGESIDLSLFK